MLSLWQREKIKYKVWNKYIYIINTPSSPFSIAASLVRISCCWIDKWPCFAPSCLPWPPSWQWVTRRSLFSPLFSLTLGTLWWTLFSLLYLFCLPLGTVDSPFSSKAFLFGLSVCFQVKESLIRTPLSHKKQHVESDAGNLSAMYRCVRRIKRDIANFPQNIGGFEE